MRPEERIRDLAAAVEALGQVVGEILSHEHEMSGPVNSRMRVLARVAQERAAVIGEELAPSRRKRREDAG